MKNLLPPGNLNTGRANGAHPPAAAFPWVCKWPQPFHRLTVFAISSALTMLAGSEFLHAQKITWSAQGLPPGVKLITEEERDARFSGTPTQSGIYNTVIYPTVNGVAGDMSTYRFNILPKNSSLPVYYGYRRISTKGFIELLAGGPGAILVLQGGEPAFTSDGVIFKPVAVPAPLKGKRITDAAAAGRRFVIKTNEGLFAYSDNQTAFKSLSAPEGILSSGSLASDGSKRIFHFAIAMEPSTEIGSNSNLLRIHELSGNATRWITRSSVKFPSNTYDLNESAKGSLAANGNTMVLSLGGYGFTGSELLLRSTDGGKSWLLDSKAPRLSSVAYGNGIFLGIGYEGVFKSLNGIQWTFVQKYDWLGPDETIIFSPREKLFFTPQGVTRDGSYWSYYQEYVYRDNGRKIVTAENGVILTGSFALSTTYIPTYEDGPFNHMGTVGKPMEFNISPDF